MHRFLLCLLLVPVLAIAQQATIRESSRSFTTYPFGNPDPVPNKGTIYPYFRYEDFSARPVAKSWKTVELENDFVKLVILPEVGGKIWSATEKATGKDFLYNNKTVKFRDVAMRGPWTSGGIEPNYGIIGHTPNCATPVDYSIRQNADGSVSCFVGTLDLLTQTNWMLEIRLPADKAWFTTRSWWFNANPLEQPYYTWMNTGIKAAGDLEFYYPGNAYIGHEGEYAAWPVNASNGKNIARYEENNFGSYKSYHVFGRYTDYFGAYWHDDDYGMARYSRHDEKPGKKIWIWGLSRQGMIWDKLLTDTDGQYVEVQSGRLFNQSSDGSSLTPFKHFGFAPYQTDTWTEYWYPVTGTGGIAATNPHGTLNVRLRNGKAHIIFQSLETLSETISVTAGNSNPYSKSIQLKPMEIFRDSVAISGDFKVTIGKLLEWSSKPDDELSRPKDSPPDFDWNSAYGLYLAGKEAVRSRYYDKAEAKLEASIAKDHNFLPALAELAALKVRRGDHEAARAHALRALAIDTYDPDANFTYGLANAGLGKWTDARDGFDIAALSVSHRSASYTQLARIYVRRGDMTAALEYAQKAMENNTANAEALQLQALIYRLSGNATAAKNVLQQLELMNPLLQIVAAERWLGSGQAQDLRTLTASARNELPHETFLQLADWYTGLGMTADAAKLLSAVPASAEIMYWRAWLAHKNGSADAKSLLEKANQQSAELVFPFRESAKEIFQWAMMESASWKPRYYLALIHFGQKNTAEASKLINSITQQPDLAAFYALRAELPGTSEAQAEKDLVKATTMQPGQWVLGRRLFELYIRQSKNTQALTLAQSYQKRFPDNSAVIMMTAKALLLNRQYPLCADLLEKSTLLPYEGSTETRQVYWAVHMLSALDKIKAKRPAEAQRFIDKTRIWPENLGVGKPYETDIDQRAEYLVEAIILRRTGKSDEADNRLAALAADQPGRQATPYGMLAQALYHRLSRSEEEGRVELENWAKASANSGLAQWCLDTYTGQPSAIRIPDDQKRLATGLFELVQ